MKILVVEDDRTVAQSLRLLLSQYNYAVDIAVDGETALQMADAFNYHLVLLDCLLPRIDGIEVCRQLRKKGFRQPILLLTGQGKAQQTANTAWSVAAALNTGADDYVMKPFDNDELIARIQALLRRGAIAGEPILTWGYLSLDPNTRRVAYRNQLVFLTPKEHAILELFLRHQETVFSARAILDQAWSSVESPGEEAVRCHLKELRQKLTAAGAPKDLIKTVYRVGYRLNPLYSSFSAGQSEECLNPAQIAELKAVNEQLRLALEELKTAEEELKQQNEQLGDAQRLLELEQQRYHDLFEFAPDAYLVTDTQGVIQAANQAAFNLFQVQSQALVGQLLTVFIDKCDLHDFRLQLNTLNFAQNWEVQVKPRKGSSLPVLITVTTIKNLHEEVTGLRWLLRDIRLRKQSEQQLQAAHAELEQRVADRTAELSQREAFLSSIYDGAEQSIFVVGITETNDFRYISFNRCALQANGLSLQDVQNKTPEDVFGLEVGALFRQNYERCVQANRSIVYEDHFIFYDRPIWTLTTLSPLRDSQGRIDRIVGTVLDISERMRVEEERKRYEINTAFLSEIATECSYQLAADDMIQTVGAKLGAYLNIAACTFWELDEIYDQVTCLGCWNREDTLPPPDRLCLSEQVSQEFLQRIRAGETIVSHPTSTSRFTNTEANVLIGLQAFITVPFFREDRWKYLFSIHDDTPRVWREDEIELVREVANRIVPRIERAYTEVALHHNQEMFSELIRNAPFGIYLVDANFRLQQINQKAEAIFSNIHPLIGRDLGEILRIVWQESCATEAIHHFRHTLASGEPYYSPIRVEPQANIEEIQAYDWQIHRITLPHGSYGVVCYFYDLSEIRRAEAALHESEQLLQLAMAGAQAGSWDWVMATGQLSWSPETYRLYGLASTSPPPKYDEWYENILHPDDRTWVNQYVNQAITQHQTDIQLEFRILHPQHGIRWIMSLGHLTVNEQGEPVRVSGINLDISDRKQAELALQKQIQQEYLLNEIAQEIRCSLNLQEVLSSTVQRVRTFLGVDRVVIFRFRPDWQGDVITESVGAEWTPILSTTISDPCFRDRYIESYRQGQVAAVSDIDAAKLEPCYVELLQQFQVKANLVVPILQNNHLWGLLIVHQCRAPRQWHTIEVAAVQRLATQVGIAIQQAELYQQLQLELNDRKQAEQKIREQAALLDIATDAILVRDLEHHILYWNQGAERLYGWTAEEALAQKANELLSATPAEISIIMQTVLKRGEWHGEIHKVTKTGKPVIVEGRWTLVRDETGQPKSVLIVDTDITEKKSLEAQFHQAQRLESLGTLTSGIAHDLNNALTPILTIAQLLRMQQREMDARSQEMLQVLEDSARRGADLVQQILTFTRGTGGERTPVEVVPLLQEVVKVTQQTFPKFITIRETVAVQPVSPVSANTTQLHQILMNLCVNARDAMPNGGTLTLSAENFEANEVFAQMNLDAHVGQYVLITVADTGTGMAPEVRDRIFDPFFTTKPLGQGTGLGLSTVLGIVRSYGGFIRVASEVGKGTQFKVYLPVIETEAASDFRETTLSMGKGELILAVDDEDSILQSTRAILETHHYRVLTANSGADAIATYAQHQQDIALVLVDMMMPDMNGITIIQVLQEMNPDIKAIAASGLLPQYQQSLESLGITICINKPYTTEELLNSIHLHLSSTPPILKN